MIKIAHQRAIGSRSPDDGAANNGSSHDSPIEGPSGHWRPTLTQEQVFRLWRCAIKDDEELVDEIIERLYENIVAFDDKRAESVIELVVRRSISARWAFRSILKDMRGLIVASPAVRSRAPGPSATLAELEP